VHHTLYLLGHVAFWLLCALAVVAIGTGAHRALRPLPSTLRETLGLVLLFCGGVLGSAVIFFYFFLAVLIFGDRRPWQFAAEDGPLCAILVLATCALATVGVALFRGRSGGTRRGQVTYE
jgi:hypothetical protein